MALCYMMRGIMKKAPTLLERALDIATTRRQRTYTDEELEVVRAWLLGDLNFAAISRVSPKSGTSSVYLWLLMGARVLYQHEHPS